MSVIDDRPLARKSHFQKNKRSAFVAGVSLILMAVAAGMAYGYFHARLVVPGDAGATAELLKARSGFLEIEVLLWCAVLVLDIVVSIAFFRFFREMNFKLSLAAMIIRLFYSMILGLSVMMLTAAFDSGINALTWIMRFEQLWFLGLILFGIHLLMLGIFNVKNTIIPKGLSWLIVVGGFCYVLIHFLKLAGDGYSNLLSFIEPYLSVPMSLAEILLAFWLLFGAIGNFRKNAAGV